MSRMINKANGEVKFPDWGIPLSGKTTRSEFLASPLAKDSRIEVKNEPYCSWQLSPARWEGKWWSVVAFFYGQKLTRLVLAARDEKTGSNWENWSEEQEHDLKGYHDEVIQRVLGRAAHVYSWGKVSSEHSPQDASGNIIVEYKK
jgi:hypothetical protein